MDDRTDVVLYTLGFKTDQAAKEGERPDIQIKGRLLSMGMRYPAIWERECSLVPKHFLYLTMRLYPSTLRVVPLADLSDIDSVLPEVDLPTEG